MLDRHAQSRLRAPRLGLPRGLLPLVAACSALSAVCLFWGFTVDDAWIVSRVAEFGKGTGRFSFNPTGPITDAVTPLGYAQLLALLAAGAGLDVFTVARFLGAAAWLGTWAWLAHLMHRTRGSQRALALALAPLVCVPGAAWAGAGLETPLVAALFTFGLIGTLGPARFSAAPFVLGFTGAIRPECWPACLLAAGLAAEPSARRCIGNLALACIAPVVLMSIRLHLFGHPLPLAAVAKPPDPSFGVRYGLGAALLSGVPWLWLGLVGRGGPAAEDRPAESRVRSVVVFLLFLGSISMAGGDWMPLFRLIVPILPWVSFEALRLGRPGILGWAGWGLAAATTLSLGVAFRPDSIRTLETRRAWVHEGRRLLEDRKNVAAVDVGWVGRATSAQITDLSGVTDPQIARLPGGHTSHHVPAALLDRRGVDTWIVRGTLDRSAVAVPESIRATYLVDARLLRSASAMGFRFGGELAIARTETSYFVLVR
jgi:hypothetical protein